MRQRKLTKEEQDEAKADYAELYKYRMTTFAGFGYDFVDKNTFDDSPEERRKFYEELWEAGGFRFWLSTYKDMLFDNDANNEGTSSKQRETNPQFTPSLPSNIPANTN